jgi:hypothetical protein
MRYADGNLTISNKYSSVCTTSNSWKGEDQAGSDLRQ